jgi:hypothetical protein
MYSYLFQPLFQVVIHLLDDTTAEGQLIYLQKHYDLAFFRVGVDQSLQLPVPDFSNSVECAQEVFQLGRDEKMNLRITHGRAEYLNPTIYDRYHYMYLSRKDVDNEVTIYFTVTLLYASFFISKFGICLMELSPYDSQPFILPPSPVKVILLIGIAHLGHARAVLWAVTHRLGGAPREPLLNMLHIHMWLLKIPSFGVVLCWHFCINICHPPTPQSVVCRLVFSQPLSPYRNLRPLNDYSVMTLDKASLTSDLLIFHIIMEVALISRSDILLLSTKVMSVFSTNIAQSPHHDL